MVFSFSNISHKTMRNCPSKVYFNNIRLEDHCKLCEPNVIYFSFSNYFTTGTRRIASIHTDIKCKVAYIDSWIFNCWNSRWQLIPYIFKLDETKTEHQDSEKNRKKGKRKQKLKIRIQKWTDKKEKGIRYNRKKGNKNSNDNSFISSILQVWHVLQN